MKAINGILGYNEITVILTDGCCVMIQPKQIISFEKTQEVLTELCIYAKVRPSYNDSVYEYEFVLYTKSKKQAELFFEIISDEMVSFEEYSSNNIQAMVSSFEN